MSLQLLTLGSRDLIAKALNLNSGVADFGAEHYTKHAKARKVWPTGSLSGTAGVNKKPYTC